MAARIRGDDLDPVGQGERQTNEGGVRRHVGTLRDPARQCGAVNMINANTAGRIARQAEVIVLAQAAGNEPGDDKARQREHTKYEGDLPVLRV